MDLRGQEIKNTYGNVVTIGSSAGSPTTGEFTNGQNSSFTASFVSGDFGVGITPNNYANLNTLTIGSAAASAGGIIDFTGTSGRLASIYTEASGKIVLAADPTNGEAGTALEFNVDGSNAMFINSSRNVGIGTTTPAEKLDVYGNLNFSVPDAVDVSTKESLIVKINSANNQSNRVIDFRNYNTSLLTILQAGNVGIGDSAPSYILDVNNTSSRVRFKANTGDSSIELSSIAGRDWLVSSKTDGAFSIYDEDASTERMRIDSSGNVGIGTSSPSAKLHVYSGEAIIATNTDGLKLSYSAGNSSGIVDTAFSDNNLEFRTNGNTKMWIANAGNVGIGTTTPETKLDVDGDIQTAAPETSTNAAWKLGNVGLGGVFVGAADYVTISVGGLVVKLPIAIFPETQDYYDRVIADGGTFEGLLGYESAVTILKAE